MIKKIIGIIALFMAVCASVAIILLTFAISSIEGGIHTQITLLVKFAGIALLGFTLGKFLLKKKTLIKSLGTIMTFFGVTYLVGFIIVLLNAMSFNYMIIGFGVMSVAILIIGLILLRRYRIMAD